MHTHITTTHTSQDETVLSELKKTVASRQDVLSVPTAKRS